MSYLSGHKRSISSYNGSNVGGNIAPIAINRMAKVNTVINNNNNIKRNSLTPTKTNPTNNTGSSNQQRQSLTKSGIMGQTTTSHMGIYEKPRTTTPTSIKGGILKSNRSTIESKADNASSRQLVSKSPLMGINNRVDTRGLISSIAKMPSSTLKNVTEALTNGKKMYNTGLQSKNSQSTSYLPSSTYKQPNNMLNVSGNQSFDKSVDNSFCTNDGRIKVSRNGGSTSKSPTMDSSRKITSATKQSDISKSGERFSFSKSPGQVPDNRSSTSTAIKRTVNLTKPKMDSTSSSLIKQYEELKNRSVSPITGTKTVKIASKPLASSLSKDNYMSPKFNSLVDENVQPKFHPRGTITVGKAPESFSSKIPVQYNEIESKFVEERDNKFKKNSSGSSTDFREMNTSPLLIKVY